MSLISNPLPQKLSIIATRGTLSRTDHRHMTKPSLSSGQPKMLGVNFWLVKLKPCLGRDTKCNTRSQHHTLDNIAQFKYKKWNYIKSFQAE